MQSESTELARKFPQSWIRCATGPAIVCFGLALVALAISADDASPGGKNGKSKELDPTAWGGDHVGKPVPEYITGGECLFCHGKEIGENWNKNRHQLTIRPADEKSLPALKSEAMAALWKSAKPPELMVGRENLVRFLRRSQAYGQLDLLTHAWNPKTKTPVRVDGKKGDPAWDADEFGKNCSGCHATGVDAETHAFSSLAIDCYSCHGDADLDHSKDSSLMLLSKKRKDPARVTTSICAQCHIRTGKSRSTGLPYPNNFIAGDNLFRDFRVSFDDEALRKLNPGDRHILENVRDVVLHGKDSMTCLTCHQVHQGSTDRHERLPKTSAICANCHESKNDVWTTKSYQVRSAVCRY